MNVMSVCRLLEAEDYANTTKNTRYTMPPPERKGKKPSTQRDRAISSGRPPCRFCGSRDHLAAGCPDVTCANCYRTGHLAANCTHEPACRFCGDQGHSTGACPTRFARRIAGTRNKSSASSAAPPPSEFPALPGPSGASAPSVGHRSYAAVGATGPPRKRPAAAMNMPPASAPLLQQMEFLGRLVSQIQGRAGSSALETRLAELDKREQEWKESVRRQQAAFDAERETLEKEMRYSRTLQDDLPNMAAMSSRWLKTFQQGGESDTDTEKVDDVNDVDMTDATDDSARGDTADETPPDHQERDVTEEPHVQEHEGVWEKPSRRSKASSERRAREGETPTDGVSGVHRWADSGHRAPTVPTRNMFDGLTTETQDSSDDEHLLRSTVKSSPPRDDSVAEQKTPKSEHDSDEDP